MPQGTQRSIPSEVKTALTWLERRGTKRTRDGMARYGIPSDNALGVKDALRELTSPKVTRRFKSDTRR